MQTFNVILYDNLQEYKGLQINTVTCQKHWEFVITSLNFCIQIWGEESFS